MRKPIRTTKRSTRNMTPVTLVVKHEDQMVGLARYTTELARALKKRINVTIKETKAPRWAKILRLFGIDGATVFQRYPLTLPNVKEGVLHLTSQTFAIPLLFRKPRVPVIVSVMDLIPLMKEYSATSFSERILFKLSCLGLKRADILIAISECTKRDIIRLLHIPKEKITVTLLAADTLTQHKIKRDQATVLYIGSELPRKNLTTLLYAVAIAKKKLPNIKLIKIGTPQTRERKMLHSLIERLHLKDNVIIKGYTKDIAEAYASATVFTFPSLYEGFGLPVLEAMSLGCPVISSVSSSLPEVGGDSVLYAPPKDAKAWADAIIRVIKDKKLQEQLHKKGIARAQQFSWDRVAKETYSIYEHLGAHL